MYETHPINTPIIGDSPSPLHMERGGSVFNVEIFDGVRFKSENKYKMVLISE